MKQTLNRLSPSTSVSDSDSDIESDSEGNSFTRRRVDQNNVSSIFRSAAAESLVNSSFRELGSRPASPMTREKLQAVLQEALDIIDDDGDDSELDFAKGAEQ
jgi:hypothetical protein